MLYSFSSFKKYIFSTSNSLSYPVAFFFYGNTYLDLTHANTRTADPPPFPAQALGGAAGFAAIGGDVPHALARRRLRELDGCFNVTERALYSRRADRAGMTDSYYLLLAPEQVTFAYNTR